MEIFWTIMSGAVTGVLVVLWLLALVAINYNGVVRPNTARLIYSIFLFYCWTALLAPRVGIEL